MQGHHDLGSNEFDILAAAAHDFKTPLALIQGLASELQQGGDPEYVEHAGREIAQASQRLVHLIDTVSLAHRVNQVELELELAPVDMRSIIDQAAYDISPLASQFEHQIEVRISRRLPTVMAHKLSVQRIVTSLLDVAVRSAKQNEKITLTARKVGEEVALSVSDASTGIKANEWAKIINQPGRVKQPSPALGDSSGVSLFAIRQLATAMHGEFSAQSKGRQSVFMLRLPQVAQLRLF